MGTEDGPAATRTVSTGRVFAKPVAVGEDRAQPCHSTPGRTGRVPVWIISTASSSGSRTHVGIHSLQQAAGLMKAVTTHGAV